MKNALKNDPTWELLDNASQQEAGEMFSRDVLRSIRLDQQASLSWWQRLLKPAPIIGTLAASSLCVALLMNTQTHPSASSQELSLSAEESFELLTADYSENDDFDDIISPISLVATNDSDMLNNLDLFMNL